MYYTLKSGTNKQTIKDPEATLDVIDSSNESQNPDQYMDRKNTKQQLDLLYDSDGYQSERLSCTFAC